MFLVDAGTPGLSTGNEEIKWVSVHQTHVMLY